MLTIPLPDRIRGCLLGGACGDALGAPVEFMTTGDIVTRYGPRGITGLDGAYGRRGAITDDTQMTMFTVDGLIRARVRRHLRGISDPPAVVHHAYLRWLATQTNPYEARPTLSDLDGWLIDDARLWARRAPGITCISALWAAATFGERADNDSKGCGTVMRDAPWGLAFAGDPERAFDYAAEAARTTHGHPTAAAASGAVASIIARICAGATISKAARHTLTEQLQAPDAAEVAYALQQALVAATRTDWRSQIIELGQGWVAEEALAIAVLCAIAAPDARAALIAAVNHEGDSDSTGAICGNLVGAADGAGAFPPEWLAELELADTIETLAIDLAASLAGDFDAEAFNQRYPGW